MREKLKKIFLDALKHSAYSEGSAIDHIVDYMLEHNVTVGSSEPVKVKDRKHKYGTYGKVKLTDDEYFKLRADFPDKVDAAIEAVDEYIKTTGKSYKDHNLVIRKWGIDAAEERARKQKVQRREESRLDFDLDSLIQKPRHND